MVGKLNPMQFVGTREVPPKTMWHGTPDVRRWGTGSHSGIHVGSIEAARDALHARIGRRADGKDWDGTQEYGKTLIDRNRTNYVFHLHGDRPGGTLHTEVEEHPPSYPNNEIHGHHQMPGGATYSNGDPIPMDARPSVFPVRITGEMTNTRQTPHEDFKANGYMSAQLKRGRAKRGYYYDNVGEGNGHLHPEISAVVPTQRHLQMMSFGPKLGRASRYSRGKTDRG